MLIRLKYTEKLEEKKSKKKPGLASKKQIMRILQGYKPFIPGMFTVKFFSANNKKRDYTHTNAENLFHLKSKRRFRCRQ